MTDYGDDWSDGEDAWMYLEEEYMMADDLAEHAVNSPPQTSSHDDYEPEEYDIYDYFIDLDYGDEEYDDADFAPHDSVAAKAGLKRKRTGREGRVRKKQRLGDGQIVVRAGEPVPELSPIVWRSQTEREAKPKLLDGPLESYALLKDWRERLKDTPAWASGSPEPASPSTTVRNGKTRAASVMDTTGLDAGEEELEEEQGEDSPEIDPAALMAALQSRLAAAGGPLSGMDPQQLLQFAMRMMTEKDAGDEIVGELADNMLEQAVGEDEEEEDADGDAPAHLVSWLSKQKAANQEGAEGVAVNPESPILGQTTTQPPTPPSSEATRSVRMLETIADPTKIDDKSVEQAASSRKRKTPEDADDDGVSATAPKKRATRSFDAPTDASQARAAPSTKTKRSGRARS